MSSTEPLDPLRQAKRWARAVIWQAERLRDALQPPGAPNGARPGFFDRIGIEQHFLLTACAQLLRALEAVGQDKVLAAPIGQHLKVLRNVREHWDEWHVDKRSPLRFRTQWPNRSPFSLTRTEGDQDLLLGEIVSLAELEDLAKHILDDLSAQEHG
ncbi:hypothetical protein PZ938_00250 [Luteipulveratus sp. YIM 133132]|uniref:hypothetical protein n=1 Tax=Luteipulveratus flavus TaxID=3031728 RepID=UPI0023B107ED|nr:hypothetical protein [Luteipulveratus sp. YIM 133132]MDE9364025.1 hypothetical protein [Luteipulveratus sp. YIM 133132]